MPYPTPPVLVPFEPEQTPNLMAGGTYSDQLNKIMEYLAQLGTYIDDNLHAIDERFADVEATIATVKQNHEAVVTALNGVTYDADHALFAGLTATGGTVTSPALVEIKSTFDGVSGEIDDMQGQIQEDQASIAELGDELNTVSQWQANASSTVTQTIPVAIDTDTSGVKTQEAQIVLFDSTGNYNADFTQTLWNAMAQLYLAAPNDDQTQLLGYLGDNSDDDHTAAMSTLRPKSSAALTAAYEAGGSGGETGPVYGVPVAANTVPGSNVSVTLQANSPVSATVRAGETLLVTDGTGYASGTVLMYTNMDEDLTLTTDAPVSVQSADLVEVYAPSGGAVPVNVVTYDQEQDRLYAEGQVIQRLRVGPLFLSPSNLQISTPNGTNLLRYVGSDTEPKILVNSLQDQAITLELGSVWPTLTSEQLSNAVQTDPTSGHGLVVTQLPA